MVEILGGPVDVLGADQPVEEHPAVLPPGVPLGIGGLTGRHPAWPLVRVSRSGWRPQPSATRSPTANTSAAPAAPADSLRPIERPAARLASTSRESLTRPAEVQRRVSARPPRLAADTVPAPSTRSRIP